MSATPRGRVHPDCRREVAEVAPSVDQAEPADPPLAETDHAARRAMPLAGPSHDPRTLPDGLLKCGCGECQPRTHPLADGDHLDTHGNYGGFDGIREAAVNAAADELAADTCPSPTPLTVAEAGVKYRLQARANLAAEDRTAKATRQRGVCRRILATDRHLQAEYRDLTTVLLSARVRPIEGGRWVPPLELTDRLLAGLDPLLRSVKRRLRRHVDEFEYVVVVSGTDSAATPHYHALFWMNDDEGTVAATPYEAVGLDDALHDHHVGKVAGAEPGDHPVERGHDDAVTVRGDPPTVDRDHADTLGVRFERDDVDTLWATPQSEAATRAAHYVAGQLPHLNALDYISDETGRSGCYTHPEAAAIAWADPASHDPASRRWVRTSGGVVSPPD